MTQHALAVVVYYSKFAKDQLFDIAYFSPIANDTPVRGPHYCGIIKLLFVMYSFH